MLRTDVIIVGCGPVGALLANLLGARGVRTLVLEREHQIHQLPRAIGFDGEVKRVFQAAGLDMSFGRSTTTLKGMDLINAGRKRMRRFDLQDEPQTNGHPIVTTFHQPELEAVIRGGLDRYKGTVDLRSGALVQSIENLSDSVQVEFLNSDSGVTETVDAEFLIGCDGSRSFVRKEIGIELEDLNFHQPWLVIDVIMKKQIDMDRWAQQICDHKRPATFVPAPPPRNRFEFMLVDGDDPDEITKLERVQEMIRPWLDPAEYEIERSAVYTFHALIAKDFHQDRVLLAGDAAHQMPPFLGQGMCAGIRDAFNLAWKLDLIINGKSGLELLGSYHSERDKHVRYVIKMAVKIGRIIQAPSRAIAVIRNAAVWISELLRLEIIQKSMSQEPIGHGFFSDKAVVSEKYRCPFPQPFVSDRNDGQRVLMDSFLGDHFTLLTRAATGDKSANPLIRCLEVFGPNSKATGKSTTERIFDVDGVVLNWLDEVKADAVLLRPDRVPFGIYRGADAELVKVAKDLQRHLTSSDPNLSDKNSASAETGTASNSEPTALAAGLERSTVASTGPEAIAYGSQHQADASNIARGK